MSGPRQCDQPVKQLAAHPALATAKLRDRTKDGAESARTLLHVVTDWPGHFPGGPATVAALVEAGADVDARFEGDHRETPLHWAASCDDVAVLDALLDAGEINVAFWGACHGGRLPTAQYLADRGAEVNWIAPWEPATPLDAAQHQPRCRRPSPLASYTRREPARGTCHSSM